MERWNREVKSVLTGVVCMVQLCFSSSALSAGTILAGGLSSPDSGVLCNGEARVCYDSFGVSIRLTGEFMGQSAADSLTRKLSLVDGKYFDRTNFKPVQGISCHTLEKACYQGDVLSEVLSNTLFGADAGVYDADALLGVSWAWGDTSYSNDIQEKAAEGRQYLLRFKDHGVLQIQADCNTVMGSYHVSSHSLILGLGPSTMMSCGPDSKDVKFLKDIAGTTAWFIKKGDLYLGTKADTGSMHFYRTSVQ